MPSVIPVESLGNALPPGFGNRLRQERKRLGRSQAQLGAAGGVGRLAQMQYEREATAPTTDYLAGISAVGVDLLYLLFGVRLQAEGILTVEQESRIERQAFDSVETCAASQLEGRLGAESRYMLFRVFRNYLTQVELGKVLVESDPMVVLDAFRRT